MPTVKSGARGNPILRVVQQATVVDMPINATVRIPESLWKRAKIEAIRRGCTVADLVQTSLHRELEEDAGNGKADKKKGSGA